MIEHSYLEHDGVGSFLQITAAMWWVLEQSPQNARYYREIGTAGLNMLLQQKCVLCHECVLRCQTEAANDTPGLSGVYVRFYLLCFFLCCHRASNSVHFRLDKRRLAPNMGCFVFGGRGGDGGRKPIACSQENELCF